MLRAVTERNVQRHQVPVVDGAVLGEVRAVPAQGGRQDVPGGLQRHVRRRRQQDLRIRPGSSLPTTSEFTTTTPALK
jgi:hypothetical protein